MNKILQGATVTCAVFLLLAGACLVGYAGAGLADGEASQGLHEQALRLTHENAWRRAEVELAEGERFYLVLDTEQRSLTLKLRGAPLHEMRFDSIEIGRPYRFFLQRVTRKQVRGQPHRQSRLAPPRPLLRLPVEIPRASDAMAETIMLPPEPETAIAVPKRFFIRYEGGVVLEFHTTDGRRDLGQRIFDSVAALFRKAEIRLRLVLDQPEAEEFYRSVPCETDLLVL